MIWPSCWGWDVRYNDLAVLWRMRRPLKWFARLVLSSPDSESPAPFSWPRPIRWVGRLQKGPDVQLRSWTPWIVQIGLVNSETKSKIRSENFSTNWTSFRGGRGFGFKKPSDDGQFLVSKRSIIKSCWNNNFKTLFELNYFLLFCGCRLFRLPRLPKNLLSFCFFLDKTANSFLSKF